APTDQPRSSVTRFPVDTPGGRCLRLTPTARMSRPAMQARDGYEEMLPIRVRGGNSVKEPPMSESRPVAFEFERVTVLRAGRRVLDEVTARIPVAGITVVSGPSGAGKTTLLRLCNRLEVPDSGTIRHRGRPLDELDPLALRRRVGMVFQR